MTTDKRVRYTKLFLKESLIRLMEEKPISRITIKELCAGAEINRATFYAHYRDQYDLLEQNEQALIDKLHRCVDALVANPDASRLPQVTLQVLKTIEDDLAWVRVLWGKNGDMKFQENMAGIFHDEFISLLPTGSEGDPREKEYTYLYTIHGCIGVIRQWILDDGDRATPEELTRLILRVSNANALIGSGQAATPPQG